MFRILSALVLVLSFSAIAQAQPVAMRDDNENIVKQGVDGKPTFLSASSTGVLRTAVAAGDSSIGKQEDAAHTTGQTGAFCLGVRNDNAATSFTNANTDFSPIGVGTSGEVFASPMAAGYASSIAKLEDSAHGSGDGITPIAAIRQDAISSLVSAANDYANLKVDEGGRLIITSAPPGETWQGCGTATNTTADVAIKAAVASNRIYVTSISCKNTSATVASSLDFKDGTTIISVGGIAQMATTSSGDFIKVFNIPLRGSVNTAFNFATNVLVTSVTCCANGYISVL